MPDLAMLDYFYGDEAEQFTFYRIPKVLFTDPSYRRISSDAKILYGLFLCNRQHHNGASGHGAGRSVCLDAGNLGRILCHESDGAYHHGHFVWQDD